MQTFLLSHVRLGRRSVVKQVQVLLVVATGLHHQQRNNFRDEQQQNAEWSELSTDMCCFIALPFGGPGRGVHYTPPGVTGYSSTMWVEDDDLPHSKQHPRLQRCWWKKPGWMEAVNWETLAMVNVAPLLHPPYSTSSLSESVTISR
jgi:hypothetical protein